MKIMVAVKQVAALDEDFEISSDGRDIDPDFLIRDLNEWDDFSLEEAVKIKEACGEPVEVIAVSVGPEEVDESLRKCLAKGADRALRVWDEAVRGSDPIAIARILTAVAMRETPDLLFAGVQSSDQAFASTGIATAGLLGWPHAAVVANLRYTPGANGRSRIAGEVNWIWIIIFAASIASIGFFGFRLWREFQEGDKPRKVRRLK